MPTGTAGSSIGAGGEPPLNRTVDLSHTYQGVPRRQEDRILIAPHGRRDGFRRLDLKPQFRQLGRHGVECPRFAGDVHNQSVGDRGRANLSGSLVVPQFRQKRKFGEFTISKQLADAFEVVADDAPFRVSDKDPLFIKFRRGRGMMFELQLPQDISACLVDAVHPHADRQHDQVVVGDDGELLLVGASRQNGPSLTPGFRGEGRQQPGAGLNVGEPFVGGQELEAVFIRIEGGLTPPGEFQAVATQHFLSRQFAARVELGRSGRHIQNS